MIIPGEKLKKQPDDKPGYVGHWHCVNHKRITITMPFRHLSDRRVTTVSVIAAFRQQ